MQSLARYFCPGLSLALWALLIALSSTGGRAAEQSDEGDSQAFDDEALFVIGNTLFTVYHEFGHALIDLLNLPVIGREEDAVDGFAAVTMIPTKPEPMQDALIVAVADGWRLQSDKAIDGADRRYWSEHALDQQRHFAIVCLMVGSDQDGFYDFALDAGLPPDRIESCGEDYNRMKQGWNRLLDPHRLEPEALAPASHAILIAFDEPLSGQDDIVELLSEDGVLAEAILDLGKSVTLPSDVTIRFAACGEANAYWSREQLEVTVCYELIDGFDAIVRGRGMTTSSD